MGTRRTLWASGISGFITAVVAGVAEYAMTGGASTWTPLMAGSAGALAGWLVVLLFFSGEEPFYTPRTVSELTEAVSSATAVEAANISRPHIGKGIRMSGVVIDVRKMSFWRTSVWLRLDENHRVIGVAKFNARWFSRLRTLTVDDHIHVDGKIEGVERSYLSINRPRDIRILSQRGPTNDE